MPRGTARTCFVRTLAASPGNCPFHADGSGSRRFAQSLRKRLEDEARCTCKQTKKLNGTKFRPRSGSARLEASCRSISIAAPRLMPRMPSTRSCPGMFVPPSWRGRTATRCRDSSAAMSAAQLGKLARVSPLSLDPLARLPRYQRWRDHGTLVPHAGELPLNAVAARPGS